VTVASLQGEALSKQCGPHPRSQHAMADAHGGHALAHDLRNLHRPHQGAPKPSAGVRPEWAPRRAMEAERRGVSAAPNILSGSAPPATGTSNSAHNGSKDPNNNSPDHWPQRPPPHTQAGRMAGGLFKAQPSSSGMHQSPALPGGMHADGGVADSAHGYVSPGHGQGHGDGYSHDVAGGAMFQQGAVVVPTNTVSQKVGGKGEGQKRRGLCSCCFAPDPRDAE
jgi:hypothetical protein